MAKDGENKKMESLGWNAHAGERMGRNKGKNAGQGRKKEEVVVKEEQ